MWPIMLQSYYFELKSCYFAENGALDGLCYYLGTPGSINPSLGDSNVNYKYPQRFFENLSSWAAELASYVSSLTALA